MTTNLKAVALTAYCFPVAPGVTNFGSGSRVENCFGVLLVQDELDEDGFGPLPTGG